MSDGSCGWGAAVDELEGDGVGVQDGQQLMVDQDGGVWEEIRRARVDEGFNGDRWLAWNQKMDQECKVAGER